MPKPSADKNNIPDYFGFYLRVRLGIDHFMNTPVHLLNTKTMDIPAKFNRYGIRQLAQDLLKFRYADTRFAHSSLKHNGDHTT